MQPQQMWIIRHGETIWTLSGQHTGRTDIALTDAGRDAATKLAARLAGQTFELVLTSPLQRAFETCRLAGFGDVAQRCDDLMEWDYGAYEGKRKSEIRAQRPDWTIWKDGVPGGETIAQVAARARRVLELARHAGGDVALFAHAHLLRVLTACWLQLPPENGKHFDLDTASIGVLARKDGIPVIRKWNLD